MYFRELYLVIYFYYYFLLLAVCEYPTTINVRKNNVLRFEEKKWTVTISFTQYFESILRAKTALSIITFKKISRISEE